MKTKSGKSLSKIGIGSYGVGGRGHRDMDITEKQDDEVYIDALAYALHKGFNFTEISLGYGHGQSILLFKKALDRSDIKREDIFLTHSLYPRDLPTIEVLNKDIDQFHNVMETDYADSTLITQSLVLKFGENIIYPLLHKLLDDERTRFVSLSNAGPDYIRAFKTEFGDSFFAHEGHLSFEVRALQDKGVFDTCERLNVANIIWRPLGRNMTIGRSWELLRGLEKKYGKTQSQTITDFRPSHYNPPPVDWNGPMVDDNIVTLVNEFDKHIVLDKF